MASGKNLTLVSVAVDGLTANEIETGWTILKDEFKRQAWVISPTIVRDPERNRMIIMVAYEIAQVQEVQATAMEDVRQTVEAVLPHAGPVSFSILEQPS